MIYIPRREFSTLPSVEGWNTDLGIQRNPMREGMTRIKEYATDTNSILEMRDAATDRFADAIQLFPRGQNPMVSVSYNNSGGGVQASNPHKIMQGGAFRPPLMRAEDLYPLSRQPRLPTSVVSTGEDVRYEMLPVDRNAYKYNPVFINQHRLTVADVDAAMYLPEVEFSPVIKSIGQKVLDDPLTTSAYASRVPDIHFSAETGARTHKYKTLQGDAYDSLRMDLPETYSAAPTHMPVLASKTKGSHSGSVVIQEDTSIPHADTQLHLASKSRATNIMTHKSDESWTQQLDAPMGAAASMRQVPIISFTSLATMEDPHRPQDTSQTRSFVKHTGAPVNASSAQVLDIPDDSTQRTVHYENSIQRKPKLKVRDATGGVRILSEIHQRTDDPHLPRMRDSQSARMSKLSSRETEGMAFHG